MKQLFPEVFTESKVDFEKLKQVLGEYVEDSNERYNFTWNGKGRALRLSQTPSLGTLRPCKEESKDWDTTQNLYIEEDVRKTRVELSLRWAEVNKATINGVKGAITTWL